MRVNKKFLNDLFSFLKERIESYYDYSIPDNYNEWLRYSDAFGASLHDYNCKLGYTIVERIPKEVTLTFSSPFLGKKIPQQYNYLLKNFYGQEMAYSVGNDGPESDYGCFYFLLPNGRFMKIYYFD